MRYIEWNYDTHQAIEYWREGENYREGYTRTDAEGSQ